MSNINYQNLLVLVHRFDMYDLLPFAHKTLKMSILRLIRKGFLSGEFNLQTMEQIKIHIFNLPKGPLHKKTELWNVITSMMETEFPTIKL